MYRILSVPFAFGSVGDTLLPNHVSERSTAKPGLERMDSTVYGETLDSLAQLFSPSLLWPFVALLGGIATVIL